MEFLDNVGPNRLGDALRSSIGEDAKLSIISSYFTIFAYGELKEELSKVDGLRLIFSEPTFIHQMQDDKQPREFVLSKRSRERGIGGINLELTLKNNLNQRALARECADWIRAKADFKSARQNGIIQSGGTYHVQNTATESQAFMGASSSFTLEGLGYERRPGVVCGVSHYETTGESAALKAMFDSVWDDESMLAEVTDQVVAQVETLYRENSPEFVYFLTLYHLFRDFMEDGEEDPVRPGLKFEDSVIWNKLYDFQKDAVVGAIRKLEKYKGCIIADSVGLGKTYEALAVIVALIHKVFPNPIIILFENVQGRVGLSAAVKRKSRAERGAVVVEVIQNTGLFDQAAPGYAGFIEAISYSKLPQSNLYDFIAAMASSIELSKTIPVLGFYPQCDEADVDLFRCLVRRLETLQSEIRALQEARCDQETTLAESTKIRMQIRDRQNELDDVSKRIKELCHE